MDHTPDTRVLDEPHATDQPIHSGRNGHHWLVSDYTSEDQDSALDMLHEIEEHFYQEERQEALKRLEGSGLDEAKANAILGQEEVALRTKAHALFKALDRLVDLNDTRERAIMHGTATMLREGLWALLKEEFSTPGEFVRFVLNKEREKNRSVSFLSNMDFILEILVPAMERLGMNIVQAVNMLAPRSKTKAREAVPELRAYIKNLEGNELRQALDTVLEDIFNPHISKADYWKRRDKRMEKYQDSLVPTLQNDQAHRYAIGEDKFLVVFEVNGEQSDAILTKVKDLLSEPVGYKDPVAFLNYALAVLPVPFTSQPSTGGKTLLSGDSLRQYIVSMLDKDRKDGYKHLKDLFKLTTI